MNKNSSSFAFNKQRYRFIVNKTRQRCMAVVALITCPSKAKRVTKDAAAMPALAPSVTLARISTRALTESIKQSVLTKLMPVCISTRTSTPTPIAPPHHLPTTLRSAMPAASVAPVVAAVPAAPVAPVMPVAFAIGGIKTFLCRAVLVMIAPCVSHAQIIADPTAAGNQQPTVLAAPNHVPLVNIQTPSAAGVSRNAYRQFDVPQQGAILNNSRTPTQTQLGGSVQGNPWLATGSARVILNEIHSNHPSQLRGHVEVAGQGAQVVVANPSGVTCDGCGFINAHRATITTGTPIMHSGNLESFRVQGGGVTITGQGMDARTTNYTDILTLAAPSAAQSAPLTTPHSLENVSPPTPAPSPPTGVTKDPVVTPPARAPHPGVLRPPFKP